jgi:hypothetical protein
MINEDLKNYAEKLNQMISESDGGDIDWMYTEHQVIPFVIEVNSSNQGFHPDYSQWRDKTVLRNRAGWQHLFSRLNGPSLHGVVETKDYQVIKIYRPGTTQLLQTYTINPNGSFYIILKAGTYDFSFEGTQVKKLTNVDVNAKVNVNF